MKPIKLYALLLIIAVTSVLAEESHTMQRHNKQFTITKPTVLTVLNPYGDVRLRKADDDQLIFHGVAQTSDEQSLSVEFSQSKGEIKAIVKHSNPDSVSSLTRFDLALIVPPMVALDLEFDGGKLSGKGIESNIKARSHNGSIQLKTSGAVDLFSTSGNIDLKLKPGHQPLHSEIQTHSGAVSVSFLKETPHFEVITGDHITSNSVRLLNNKKQQGRTWVYGTSNNQATHEVQIKTDTGPIRLIDLDE